MTRLGIRFRRAARWPAPTCIGFRARKSMSTAGCITTATGSMIRICSGGLNRDPIAERGGINLYAIVGNDPVFWIDPYGIVIWKGVFQATAGIIGNGLGIFGGFALGVGTGWTGVGAV